MKLNRTQLITTNALLSAIVLLFVFVPVNIGPVQLAFIPLVAIIISAEFIGVKNSLFTGLFFGILSLIGSFMQPSLLAFAFNNPLVSVLPRILIGVASYYATIGIKKAFPKLPTIFSYSIGTVAGVLTNTIGVLGMILLLFNGKPLGEINSSISIGFIGGIVITNSLLELAICTIITPPIIIALKKAFQIKD